MDSSQNLADAPTIPSELMGQLPRRTCISNNGIRMAIAATGLLAFAVFLSYVVVGNSLKAMRTSDTLRREGSEAVGLVGWTHKSEVDYTFTVDGRSFTGEASMPNQVAKSLDRFDRLPIRYLPSNPVINHPAAWEESRSPWLGIALAILSAAGAFLPLGWLRNDRRLVAEGKPTVAVITKWVRGSKGGAGADYEFRTECGSATTGSTRSAMFDWNVVRQKTGVAICVLYLPTNPRQNLPYEELGYRVAQ